MEINEEKKNIVINKIYKLLPIYEGKVLNDENNIPKEKAYDNFKRNLSMCILSVSGLIGQYGRNETLDNVILILDGLKTVGIDNQSIVKNAIFNCIRNIKKL